MKYVLTHLKLELTYIMQTMDHLLKTFQIKNQVFQPDNNIFWDFISSSNAIFETKVQALTLGARTLILHANIYWSDSITTILCTYTLKPFAEQPNLLKIDDDGITTMEKFAGKTIDITLKNYYT